MLEEEAFLLPIVHAEADYFFPLTVGDEVEIIPSAQKVGTTSFSLHYQFWKGEKKVGQVTLVHVAICKATKSSIPIPLLVLDFLKGL
jgi:1,4-dihydroxy-2-naphthoyl-CoA hydrolase